MSSQSSPASGADLGDEGAAGADPDAGKRAVRAVELLAEGGVQLKRHVMVPIGP